MSTSKFVQATKMSLIALILMITMVSAKAGEFPFLFHAHDASGNIQTAIDELNARLKSIGVTNSLASNIVVQASTLNNGLTVTGGGINITGNSTFSNDVDVVGTLTGVAADYSGAITVVGASAYSGLATFSNSVNVDVGNLVGNSSSGLLGFNTVQANIILIRTNNVAHGSYQIINDTQLVYIVTALSPDITNVIVADVTSP